MLSITLSLCPENERQQNFNNVRPCMLEYEGDMTQLWSIIELSAAFLGNNAHDKIVTMPQNDRQRSVNDFWSCILDNQTVIKHRWPTINPSAAFIGINASDDIASASYNWVPTEPQLCLWRLRMLHSNELHCAVPKSSFPQSVFAI